MKNPFEIYTNSGRSRKAKLLEWDESAFDSQADGYEVVDKERNSYRFLWLKFLLGACFLVLFVRLIDLQLVNGSRFRLLSENNRIRSQSILAPRGLVFDFYGQPLVQNTASFNLVAVPFDLPTEGLAEEVAGLSESLDLEFEEVMAILNQVGIRGLDPVLIKSGISEEDNILFETKASQFPGFFVQKIPIRNYLAAPVYSHILGYTGLVGPDDVENDILGHYASVDYIGKLGIEFMYENYLHGENGENLVEVDAAGHLVSLLGENAPEPGDSLKLNIDKELQQRLYDSLIFKAGTNKAAAVAMNPATGQVLALVSLPGYDNNLFAKGIKFEDFTILLNDKNLPLFNRAISGTYPPGSTVKPMVAAAALQEGVVKETTVINDRGLLVIPNQFDPAISYNFYGWNREGLGAMDVRSAIAKSSDIYFYTVGGGHPDSPIDGLGAEKLAEYYRKFNLGSKTQIDLPGEKEGLVADPYWKSQYFKGDAILSKWYLGNTYHISIGQGDMLSTPLQVALWTSIIANEGVGMKPQILNQVTKASGEIIYEYKPEVLVNSFIDPYYIKVVQEGMRLTVTEGSARQLLDLSIQVAGKTGTSQFDGSDPSRTHAWFTAYAPFEDPEIVITVIVEAGGEGHAAAVPVAKDILKWWEENRYEKNKN
ncbi:MAG: penicillin-binding protein 2 [Candidatus Doudnabacteria bacterium CG10_big_fil_rev_8_21_14_0_10_42_18]|uniref:Penicillin-binding protein 2 n=1 Tax=Candidatus Doudnabacteria bacterium CG10_big_fil_rev_8_21_14_0_10_42_18 TaxID=1974552 RepID=A0A2H0VBY2_9BACT|nr:MAG: penicillin-binding protein 2 [Candidatus Doudnabacteria bacterium CG10_big_fil_rev_8_21_14_0_10_42_18]